MKSLSFIVLLIVLLGAGCSEPDRYSNDSTTKEYQRTDSDYYYNSGDDYDFGYEWAADNDIDNFDDCQYEFGTSEAEDGCNDYVKDNFSNWQTFGDYDCTEDCSGHEAGYEWAENNRIDDVDDCGGNSDSFIEGCWQFVEDNY